jgi:excisionase family DNA binding protein
MTDLPDKTLLRVDEVAAFFRVTERTIYLWCEHGHLAAERTPGKSIRITRESALKCRLPYEREEGMADD